MDLLSQTKYLLRKTGLKPDKLKGQNFCIDPEVIQQMVATAKVSNQDVILEVGPGFGFLTVELVKKAKQVIAVELDSKLIQSLKKLEDVHKNLEVIEKDVLRMTNDQLPMTPSSAEAELRRRTNYKIVANLPYSITSAFLKKFLTAENKPQSMTLLLQKEVAQRICAQPGEMSLLAISVQLYSQPKIVKIVESKSFWPQPKVASAILHINQIQTYPDQAQVPEKIFWQVVRSGFSSKRKQLHNNLQNSLHLTAEQSQQFFNQSGLNPKVRAQELTILDWLKLAKSYQEFKVDGNR